MSGITSSWTNNSNVTLVGPIGYTGTTGSTSATGRTGATGSTGAIGPLVTTTMATSGSIDAGATGSYVLSSDVNSNNKYITTNSYISISGSSIRSITTEC